MMSAAERCCTSRPERPATSLLTSMLWAMLLFPSVSCLQLSSARISSGTRTSSSILGGGKPSVLHHASARPTTTTTGTTTTLHMLQNACHATRTKNPTCSTGARARQSTSSSRCRHSWRRTSPSVSAVLPAQRSALFSSPGAGMDGDGSDGKKNKGSGDGAGRWIRRLNPIPLVKKVVASMVAFQAAFRARFAALPRKAKMVVLAQLLALGLVVGSVGHKVYVNTVQEHGRDQARPVEVPYSTFMDMAEISGKGHVPGLSLIHISEPTRPY